MRATYDSVFLSNRSVVVVRTADASSSSGSASMSGIDRLGPFEEPETSLVDLSVDEDLWSG